MIVISGPRNWTNVHVTHETRLRGLASIDNSDRNNGVQRSGLVALKSAASEVEQLVADARRQKIALRALGSGWALTDIAMTQGWLLDTKMLNGCFEVSPRLFESIYPPEQRPYVIVAQAGISIGELNAYLEVPRPGLPRRALKTAGIGAGQTVAGSISGNTHGAAIAFGSTPDYVVGIQLVTGTGRSLWIERTSYPVLNDAFVEGIGARAVRDDAVFDATVVSFGCFGVITALAIETRPIYRLQFGKVRDTGYDAVAKRIGEIAGSDLRTEGSPYHYEFVFNPYNKQKTAMVAEAPVVGYEEHVKQPVPMWIVRSESGLAPGDPAPKLMFNLPVPAALSADVQYEQYRKRAILDGVTGTPGHVFAATITYMEGYNESAISVPSTHVLAMTEISSDVIRRLGLPCLSQVRLVHPSRATLAFTSHAPKTAVFEFDVANDARMQLLEGTILRELRGAGIAYTLHWSKNSGIDAGAASHMYGERRIQSWRAAREVVFGGDASLIRIFENDHLRRAGLA